MVSTISNDLFRNRLSLIWVRVMVLAVTIPIIVLALKSPSILRIYLITNILACATMPSMLLGLIDGLYFIRGFDVACAGFGGLLSVFIFGCIYYGNAKQGAELLILTSGLYAKDWSVFGAFLTASLGSLVFLGAAIALRTAAAWGYFRITGNKFDEFDRPRVRPEEEEEEEEGACTI